MVKRVLLVHAGAPGHKKDHHYVAQAQAYVGLGSISARRLEAQPARVSQNGRAKATFLVQKHVTSRSLCDSEPHLSDHPVYVEDTQLAYTALESQLPSSSRPASTLTASNRNPTQQARVSGYAVIDYAVTKAVHATAPPTGRRRIFQTPAKKSDRTNEPWTTPATNCNELRPGDQRLSQSSYLVTPVLERPNKRQRVRLAQVSPDCRLRIKAASQPIISTVTNVNDKEASGPGTNAASASDTVVTNDNTSELPTSYSVSDKERKGKGSLSLSQRSAPDLQSRDHHHHKTQRVAQSQPEHRSPQKRSPLKARRILVESIQPGLEQPNAVSPDQPVQGPANHLVAASAAAKRAMEFHPAIPIKERSRANEAVGALSLEMRPPCVERGTATFTTHITPALSRLLDGNLANSFKPVSQSRDIARLERGCWHVHVPDWPLPQFSAFWKVLERFIGSGSAGWGVWCSRGPETDLASVNHQQDTTVRLGGSSRPSNMLGPIRLYCWGEVVQHTYLLLYVASNSKIRRLGAQWLDAEGTVVIQMLKK